MRSVSKWSLILCLVLAMLLSGCAGEQDIAGTVEEDNDQVMEMPVVVGETAAEQEEREVSLGRIQGGVYTNAYVGIGCKLDGDWEYYTAEELQELPGYAAQQLEGTALEESLKNVDQFVDMKAENAVDFLTVNILFSKTDMQTRLMCTADPELLLDQTLDQKDVLAESYAQAGILVSDMEKVTVTFLGAEQSALLTTAEVEEIPTYILQLFDYSLGQYGMTMTVYSYLENNTQDVLDLFYSLE